MRATEILSRFSSVSSHPDGGFLARCPGHGDSRPSLRIWFDAERKARFVCRAGCETKSILDSVQLRWRDLFDLEGLEDVQTISAEKPRLVSVAHTAGLAMYVDQTRYKMDSLDDGDQALEYAQGRFGISAEDTERLGVGFDPGGDWTQFPYRSRTFARFPRLTVPLWSFDGIPQGLQGRDLSGQCEARWVSLSNPEGLRWGQYGYFRGTGDYGVTIVCEGPGDGLTAVAAGYSAVVIRGAALTSPELIAELADGLEDTRIVIAGDADEAGRKFTEKLAKGLALHGRKSYRLQVKGPDITAWREADPDKFREEFHAAVADAELISTRKEVTVSTRDSGNAAEILRECTREYGDSDAANAHALVRWSDCGIRFSPGLGFLVWTGKVWERDEYKVRQMIHSMGAALVLDGYTKEARGFTMSSRITSLLKEVPSVPGVKTDQDLFDAQHHLLSFENGTVNLKTGALQPHSKSDLITACLDIDYVPDAPADRWVKFLAEIFRDNPEMIDYMQRMVGYGITGQTSEQCMCICWGKGKNGKNVFQDTITRVFRALTKVTRFSTFEEKRGGGINNDIAALRGSRLVMASEGESGKALAESVVKSSTGDGFMTARFLFSEEFTFSPTFLIMLATNHKPMIKSQDEGIWRRIRLIPFRRYFREEERDKDLPAKLLAEREGIAAWAVRGAMEWYAKGLQDPDSVVSAGHDYRESSDMFAGFFGSAPSRYVKGADCDSVNGAEMYLDYKDWAEAEGLPAKEVLTRRAFYSAMEERGAVKGRDARGVTLKGIRKADDTAPAAGPGIFA